MKIGLIIKRRVFFILLIIQVYTIGWSQSASIDKYGIDQQLANGVYFEDIYYNALGHPNLMGDTFQKGNVVYRNQQYYQLDLKYDIHSGHLLLKHHLPEIELVTILTNEFVASFDLNERKFEKISFPDKEPEFYQIIMDQGNIHCYYKWFKVRKESITDDKKLRYKFSGDNRKAYVFIDGQLIRFYRNGSFWRLFPDDLELKVFSYLRRNKVKVKSASDQEMKDLIMFCQDLTKQGKMQVQ
jgi:hypothetical protein